MLLEGHDRPKLANDQSNGWAAGQLRALLAFLANGRSLLFEDMTGIREHVPGIFHKQTLKLKERNLHTEVFSWSFP